MWWADTTVSSPGLAALLSEDETDRWRRLRVGGDAYLVAHALARAVVGAPAGLAPRDVRFAASCVQCGGAHGKPFPLPPSGDLAFSLSHTHGRVAVAVVRRPPADSGARSELGVDVERLALRGDPPTRHVLTPPEHAALDTVAPERRVAAFIRYWTRKEAVLKASGHGIGFMTQLTVSGPDDPAAVVDWDLHPPDDVALHDLAGAGDGYAGCLAVLGGPVAVSEHDGGPLLRALATAHSTG